jgi:hypothetical protein
MIFKKHLECKTAALIFSPPFYYQRMAKLPAYPNIEKHGKGQYAKPDENNCRAGILNIHENAHANQDPCKRVEIVQDKIGEVEGFDFHRSRFGPDVDENAPQDKACEPD